MMFKLFNVKFDLLAINIVSEFPSLNLLMPYLLMDLEKDLKGGNITSVDVPLIDMSYEILYGTKHDDILVVSDSPLDPINTIVVGNKGNDVMVGGFGDDIMLGGDGNDVILGLFGNNILYGGKGNDSLFGIVDTIGSLAAPIVTSGVSQTPPNILFGDVGNDTLVGNIGFVSTTFLSNDVSNTDFGGNSLYGGSGDDSLYGTFIRSDLLSYNLTGVDATFSFVSSYLDGGDGNDYLVGNIDFIYQRVENSDGNLVGDYHSNTLLGGKGNDTLIGNISCDQQYINCSGTANYVYSSDFLNGGDGDDLLIGDCNSVVILISNNDGRTWVQQETCGDDVLIGGKGNDTLIGDVNFGSVVVVNSGLSNSSYTYIHGNNTLFGGEGDDMLTGGFVDLTSPNDVLGHNQFVYDGKIKNGHDQISDFNINLDTLVGQNGATFSNGGIQGGNLVINVHDRGHDSTITLMNIHTDVFASIMQTHAVVV